MKSLCEKILFLMCGVSVAYGTDENRIVGGVDAEDGAFPYQVSLRQKDFHFCGGSIIDELWILTAAHCVVGQKEDKIRVVVGSNLLDSGGSSYDVEKIISHSNYSSKDITNDIALLKLKKNVSYDNKVQSIRLPNEDTDAGTHLTLTGWGRTKIIDLIIWQYPDGKSPNKLQMIKLVAISKKECQKEHLMELISDTNICTLTKKGEGACHGDSGGPLVHNDVQVGIVSWGIPCAKGKPDVFTKVYGFLDWIKENMEENSV